jgi:hypothetical protein
MTEQSDFEERCLALCKRINIAYENGRGVRLSYEDLRLLECTILSDYLTGGSVDTDCTTSSNSQSN